MNRRRPFITAVVPPINRMRRLPADIPIPDRSEQILTEEVKEFEEFMQPICRRRANYIITLLTRGYSLEDARHLANVADPPDYLPPTDPWPEECIMISEELLARELLDARIMRGEADAVENSVAHERRLKERRKASMAKRALLGISMKSIIRDEALVRTGLFEAIHRQRALHAAGADVFRDSDLYGLDLDFVVPQTSRF
jgi:hypothetical protein